MGAGIGKKAVNTILDSNKSINSAFDFLTQGAVDIKNTAKMAMSDSHTMESAINSTYKKGTGTFSKDGAEIMRWSKSKVAGSSISGAIGLRAVGGGGLYKDRYGNTDIVGIPGI